MRFHRGITSLSAGFSCTLWWGCGGVGWNWPVLIEAPFAGAYLPTLGYSYAVQFWMKTLYVNCELLPQKLLKLKLLKNVYYFERKAVIISLLHVDLFFWVCLVWEKDVKNVKAIQLECNSCMFFPLPQNFSGLLSATSFQPLRPLPSVRILVDKINVEHSVPMYAEQLVNTVSSLSQPSDNLLHYCYSHCYLKVKEVFLTAGCWEKVKTSVDNP